MANSNKSAMSEEELGTFEPSTEVETVSSQNDEFSTIERIKICFKPTYQVRKLKNKGAVLVLVWTFLGMSAYYYIKSLALMENQSELCLYIVQVVMVLVAPFAGWLADVRVGRYRVIYWSICTMWISASLLTVSLIAAQLVESYRSSLYYLQAAFLASLGIGCIGFQANIIQFGVDQLTDASTTEIISFINWLACFFLSSGVVAHFIPKCTHAQYKLIIPLLLCASLSTVACLIFLCNNVLIKEPVTQNPFKLIFNVVKYAIKNRRPRQRSAFTYCEDDIPSRIDFGKSKYGGPFTIEQVEDVKTFFRLIGIVFIVSAVYGMTDETAFKMYLERTFRNQATDKTLGECSYSFFFMDTYDITGALLIPLNEFCIYPLFHRCLPSITCYWKVVLGVSLHLGRYIVLVILVAMAKQYYIQADGSFTNGTIECLFQEDTVVLSNTLDYRWFAIPDFLSALSYLLIIIGTIELILLCPGSILYERITGWYVLWFIWSILFVQWWDAEEFHRLGETENQT